MHTHRGREGGKKEFPRRGQRARGAVESHCPAARVGERVGNSEDGTQSKKPSASCLTAALESQRENPAQTQRRHHTEAGMVGVREHSSSKSETHRSQGEAFRH